jgi:MipA family protein
MLTHLTTNTRCIITLCAALLSTSGYSQTTTKPGESPWSFSAGLGIASAPEYEGASKRATSLAPVLDLTYRTNGYGTIGFGAKSRGVSWTILDTEAQSFGVSLSASSGRVDNKDGSAFRPGSKRLKGMGEIKASPEFGVFGHMVVGVPIIAEFYKGIGNGKQDAKDFSFKGHGGSRFVLSTELPWKANDALSFSVSPNLVWADKKYTQTFFGVTAAQSARSGFKAFNASGGVKSLGLNLGAQYKIDQQWSAQANLGIDQLRGDAGKSPITQKKAQSSAFAGFTYKF